jgi:hypothetical protein
MAAATNKGAAVLDALRPELEKAFRDIPPFGEIGFRVFFAEGEPVRVEYSAALSRRMAPKAERGQRWILPSPLYAQFFIEKALSLLKAT